MFYIATELRPSMLSVIMLTFYVSCLLFGWDWQLLNITIATAEMMCESLSRFCIYSDLTCMRAFLPHIANERPVGTVASYALVKLEFCSRLVFLLLRFGSFQPLLLREIWSAIRLSRAFLGLFPYRFGKCACLLIQLFHISLCLHCVLSSVATYAH